MLLNPYIIQCRNLWLLPLLPPVGNENSWSSSGPTFPLNFCTLGAQKELTLSSEVLLLLQLLGAQQIWSSISHMDLGCLGC